MSPGRDFRQKQRVNLRTSTLETSLLYPLPSFTSLDTNHDLTLTCLQFLDISIRDLGATLQISHCNRIVDLQPSIM